MNQLWRAKIDKIQAEYDRKTGLSSKNQHIFLSIIGLAKCFVGQGHLERSKVLTEIQNCANVSVKSAESILDHIEAYGIVGSYCQKGAGLLPDSFFYYPGIQGYFDYASAIHLITEYENPSAIDFEKCGKIDTNTMYCLAVISIQQYKYLITQNPTIRKVMFHFEIPELRFYALQHSHPAIAIQFKDHCMEYMRSGAEGLITIVNKLVLPLSRISGHPLGITLLDEFLNTFNRPAQRDIEKLAKRIGKCNPEYLGMTSEQFVISAAYAFLCNMGWNEDEFYNYSKDEAGNLIGGVDLSIGASYPSATHGAQSSVMTVCEKYVWAARNYISGFLGDRLPFGDKQIQITDYNLLDDFMIPIQEICQIDPDNIPYDRPWHIPEPATVFADKELGSKESISEHIKCAPEIDWAKWIYIDNKERHYSIPSSNLLALKTYSCFYGLDTETCLFINSIVVPSDEVSEFVLMSREENRFQNVCDPSDWDGGVDASCYITPKEICWFPWKKHYDSYKAEEYPNISIHSAVESCCYNFTGYSDVYYSMPSTILRTLMGIVDTDGYHYFDKDKNIISEFSISGEKWRTTQEFVLVDEGKIENVLSANGLSLIWIMQEMRRETGNAKEKFGEFFVEKRRYYIGYFANGNFVTEQMLTEFSENLY